MSRFPDDENGAVLQHMADRGMDLTLPRTIEFEHCFPNEAAARAFLAEVEGSVREATLIAPDVEAESGWEVQCSEWMVPTHAAITATELRLAKAAERFGGYADGWGALSNPDGSPA